ncbi:hypothetical protein CYMTET_33130, partial [Cymbomonas tetramitiformis]
MGCGTSSCATANVPSATPRGGGTSNDDTATAKAPSASLQPRHPHDKEKQNEEGFLLTPIQRDKDDGLERSQASTGLASLCGPPPHLLYDVRKTKVKWAREWLNTTRNWADRVAQAASNLKGGDLVVHKEDFKDAVQQLLTSSSQCAKKPLLIARLVSVQQPTHRLLLALGMQNQALTVVDRRALQKAARETRLAASRVPRPPAGKAGTAGFESVALLELHLTATEVMLANLPTVDAAMSAFALTLQTAFGAGKSVVMCKVDDALWNGIGKAVELAAEELHRKLCHDCFVELTVVNYLAVQARGLGGSQKNFKDFEIMLQGVHDRLFKSGEHLDNTDHAASGAEERNQAPWATRSGRWEPMAAFAHLLGDLVARGGDHPLPSALLRRICIGDETFIGLRGLLTLGLSPAGMRGPPAGQEAVEKLVRWALRLPSSENTHAWAREGLDLLIGELRHVAAQSIAHLLVAALPVVSAAEGQAASKAASVGIALDELRSALLWVGDTANAALPLCRKTADVLRAWSGLDGPAVMSAAAKVQLRRELQKLVSVLGEKKEGSLRLELAEQLRNAVKDGVERLNRAMSGKAQHLRDLSWEENVSSMPEVEAAVAALAVGLTQKAVRPAQATLDRTMAALQVLLCTAGVPADKKIGELQGIVKLIQELGAASTWRPILEKAVIEAAASPGCRSEHEMGTDLSKALSEAVEERAMELVERALKQCDGEGEAGSDAGITSIMHGTMNATADAAGIEKELSGILSTAAVHMSTCCSLLEHVARAAHGCAAALNECLIAPLSKRKDASLAVAALRESLCELVTAEGVREDQAHRYWGVARSTTEPGEAEARTLPPLDAVPSTASAALRAAEAEVSLLVQDEERASFLRASFRYLRVMLVGARDFTSTPIAGEAPSAESEAHAENLKAAVQSLKMTAVQQLEELVTGVPEVEAVAATVGEVCGAMVAPTMGAVGSALKSGMRAMAGAMRAAGVGGLTLEVEPVREVAAISMLRVLEACQRATAEAEEVRERQRRARARHGARATEVTGSDKQAPSEETVGAQEEAKPKGDQAGEATAGEEEEEEEEEGAVDPGKLAAEIEMLREELQQAVMLALPLEPSATVRAVLANGDLLAAELNSYCCGSTADLSDAEEEEEDQDRTRRLDKRPAWGADEGDEEDQDQMRRLDKRQAWGAIEHDVRWEVEAQLAVLEDLRRQAERQTDVFEKQLLLGRCRGVQAAIAQMAHGVRDAGTVLGVVVAFLRGMDAKLEVIATQLEDLQGGVRAMCMDLRRLAGQPVLELMQEEKCRRRKQWSRLQDNVHIPIEGVVPHGDQLHGKPRERKMLELVKETFLQPGEKDLLLLSGRAGSGKSTFVNELEHYLENVYPEVDKSMAVVLVRVSLPTLENPLTNLFGEALRQKGLREAQIHELRDLTQAGKVRLIFLLDAYDELKPQFQFKNLYVTNNLEQYGARVSPVAGNPPQGSPGEASEALPQGPKVIITTRTELLAHDKHYWRHFVPVQVDVPERDTEDEAWKFYLELRIADFGAKLMNEYIDAKVALEVRQAFAKHFGELSPVSKQTFQSLASAGSDAVDVFNSGPLVAAACHAMSAHHGRDVDDRYMVAVRQAISKNKASDGLRELYDAVAVLSLGLRALPPGQLSDAVKAFCDQLPSPKAEGEIWQRQHYTTALESIPELTQLTTTPFMVKIVTEILPALFQAHDSDTSIQANLLLLLTEDAMQVRMMWDSEVAATDEESVGGVKSLGNESLRASFEELVVEVASKLREKDGMLLEQAPLVEMLRFKKRASAQALQGGPRAREPAASQPAAPAEADVLSGGVLQHVEEGICREVLPYVLQSALRRLPVRRTHIYGLFVSRYVAREAQKASTTAGALDTETVKRAGEEFSQQLALRMGCENVSKVVAGARDTLFQKDSVWDSFVRDTGELGALRAAARHAAPVQFQHGVLTFIHKTVQEYLCASGLRRILKQVLREQAVSLEALSEQLRHEQLLAAEARGASSITNRLLGKHAAPPNKASKTRPAGASNRELDALTAAKALRHVETALMASEWMELDLRYEEAVRDFLTDLFLDNQEFVEEMHFLAVWAECRCRGGHLAGEEAHACDLLLQNVRTLLTGKLASRDGGTLLHVAAADGFYSAVLQLLQLLQFAGADSLLEQRDSKERTPLQCAKKHMQVAAALEVASMPRSVVEELRCELQEQRGRQWTQLHDKVHIPIEGMTEVNGVFPTTSNMGKDLLQLVKDEFLDKHDKDVLLISGPAGSGKSTFIQQLEHTLWRMYMEQPTGVLLVSTSLATLRNPLTDLISEALVNKGLREDQIHELRRLTQAGEVRLILLLDGYDELGPKFQFKNLYVTNTLEQYRKQESFQAANGSTPPSWAGPKVIIATRTELLVRKANYKEAFLPIEMGAEGKGIKERALDFLVELRIAPFQKLDQYMYAKAAMDLRNAFQRQMGDLAPLSEEAAAEVCGKVAQLWGLGTNPHQQPVFNSTRDAATDKELPIGRRLVAACHAVTVIGGGTVDKERLDQLNDLSDLVRDHKNVPLVPLCQMAAVFAMALADPPAELAKCIKLFCDMQAKTPGEDRVLLYENYKEAFDLFPELVELTTTPFTVEIVMEVLPQLRGMQSTETSIKQKLMLILDEYAMQVTWQQICQWRSESDNCISQREGDGLSILQKVQKALDGTAEERAREEGLSALKKLCGKVFEAFTFTELDMHRKPNLVRLARAQRAVPPQAGSEPCTGSGAEAESDDEMERLIRDEVVPHVLRGALRRTKVRRSHMYAIFVRKYVERKAAGAGSEEHTAETVRRESLEYSQRLAVQMVRNSVTKVRTRIDSELFHQDSIWDPFLWGRGSKLLPVVQKVAPVHSDGAELSFIHKTVQEYLCAEALCGMLHKIFGDLALNISDLRRPRKEAEHTVEAPADVNEDKPMDTAGIVAQVGQGLAKSEWVEVNLRQEDIVRDFLVDMLIDDADFLEEMLFCQEWAERGGFRGQASMKFADGGADMLEQNLRSVLSGTLPKRNQGTLLHVVAAEGSYFAVSKLLELKGTKSFEGLLERRDDEERTPLFCAAQHGHAQLVAALRAAGAEVDVRSKLQPRIQLIATVPFSLIPQRIAGIQVRGAQPAVRIDRSNLVTIGGEDFPLEHGIIGAPAAAPSEGRWRYEVEVNLDWNMFDGRPLDEEKFRKTLGMSFCIGWNSRNGQQTSWSHVNKSLEAAIGEGGDNNVQPWYQNLGLHLGMNKWSCGLRDTGEWQGPSAAPPLKNHSEAAWPCLPLKFTIGMLLDCDTRTMYVSRSSQGWMEHRMGEDLAGLHMFPAASWSGCHGTLAFNFGESPWQCFLPTPGGREFHPIRDASSGNIPVMEAASEGHMDVCALLLDSSAVEDTGRRHHRTLLHWAAWWGSVQLVEQVLRECVDPIASMRATDADGLNAAWHAVKRGHAEVLRALCQSSTRLKAASFTDTDVNTVAINVEHVATEGRTPVHAAAEMGDVKMVQVLKELGANFQHAANDGRNPAHRAAAGGHVEVLRMLLQWELPVLVLLEEKEDNSVKLEMSIPGDRKDNSGASPVHFAAEGGHVEMLPEMKDLGVNLNCADNEGWTAAHKAAAMGHAEVLLILKDLGADFSLAAKDGMLPANRAARQQHMHALQALNVDTEDRQGRTALTLALAIGDEAAASVLLEAGADVNAGSGQRPLYAAAEKGLVEMTKMLVREGAEMDAKTSQLLTLALTGGHDATAVALLEAGAGMTVGEGQRQLLHVAAEKGMPETVNKLISLGLDVDSKDSEGHTALTLAMSAGYKNVVAALLTAGAGTSAGAWQRPLPVAVEKGLVEMVRVLVSKAEVSQEGRSEVWKANTPAMEQAMQNRLLVLAEMLQEVEMEQADMVHKAERYNECRQKHAELRQMSRNIKDLGAALDMPTAFLVSVDDGLDGVSASLDGLQEQAGWKLDGPELVQLMKDSVTGLQQLQAQRRRLRMISENLREDVYVPAEGVRAGEDGLFEMHEANPPLDLLQAVKESLLGSSHVQVLLLSGAAGCGKSKFMRELLVHLNVEHEQLNESAGGMEILVLSVSLGTLQNPLTSLFHEALAQKGLRDAEIDELRNLTHAGKVGLIFLLEDYDKMPQEFEFKNLWMTNSLEQYRAPQQITSDALAASAYPKMIITSRTELLMRTVQYASSFVPLEMDNNDKCDESKAMGFFLELRIVSFENKLDAYMHAKVALEVRRAFQLRVGALAPVSEEAARGLFEAARRAFGVSGDSAECECVKATCLAVAVTGGGEVPLERLTQFNNGSKKLPTDGALPFYQMALVLATALKESPADLDKCLRVFAGEQARLGQEERIWQHADYRMTFDVIPELRELTTTPFMVEIVTEILPQLDAMQSTDASIKAKLLLLLDERATQLTWRQICTWRSEHDANPAGQPAALRTPILQRMQEALDGTAKGHRREAGLKALEELSDQVGDVLKEKKLVLEQPKLVAIARAQTKHWSGAVPDGRARRSVVGDWTDEAVDDAVEDVLEDPMIDAATEEEICGKVMRYVLRTALRRTKVRGSHIYRMFVERYVEREARKAATGGAHTADSVRREGRQYAQRLALEMVSESVSKVPIAIDSELFHKKSIWDPFLRGEELLQAAQKAAPVLNDGTVLTFIHKTVQEYLCAAALRDILHRVFHDLAVPLKRLQDDLIQSTAESMTLEQGHASEREQKGRGAGGPRSAQGVSAGVRVGPEGSTQEDAAMTEKALLRVEQRLLKSVWARVDLRREDVVRDFLVDMFLDEPELVAEVRLLVTWVERRCKGGRLQRGEACEGGMLPENVRAVLGGALPKRDGGTLLHAAASEGSYFAVTMALEMIDARLLEAVDDEGRTPLFCAAQRGHAQVVAALRAAGAKHDARSKLQPSVRLVAVVPFTKIPQTEFGQAVRAAQPAVHVERGLVLIGGKEFILEHGIVGAPAAAPFEGSWRFEVDLDLKWNFFQGSVADEDVKDTLCLGFCVGWSSQDARHISWNHVTNGLDEVTKCLDEDDSPPLQSWFQGLGFQLGTNHWSCGLRDSGEWNSPSGAVSHAECNSSIPSAAARAPIDMKCTVAMLLDCDARKLHVSTGAKWVEHDVGDLGGRMFPAVSWMGCHGEVSFNFGERPWRCEVPTPGGDRFRPICEAGSGNTPVMEAASEGHMEVCSLLLDSVAVEDVGRRHQRTLLHWAAWWGDAELARRVLEVSGDRVACIRAIDGDGLNAVWHAADRGHAEDAGADLSHADNDGSTPAHSAAGGGYVEVLRVLQDAGADLSHA